MIDRDIAPRLGHLARQFPAITLVGPRQSGKSTLCRMLFPDHAYANLETPDTRSFARDDPRSFLGQFNGGVILDEIQRAPELTSWLQERIDEAPDPGRWVLTGSQNLVLLDAVSQSLAGRTALLTLLPLTRREVMRFPEHPGTLEESILAGGYPRILDRKLDPHEWLAAYIATYIERDVRQISNIADLTTFQRFLELCAGRTSQLLNYSTLGNDTGVAQPTAKAWFSVLEASYVAFRLPAFSSNLRKRLVKMPKLHFHDTGVACRLLGIRTVDQLRNHPLRGALYETWVVSEIVKHRANAGASGGLFHYRDQNANEADLIIEAPELLRLVEAKSAQTIAPGLLEGAARITEVLASVKPCSATLAYGGSQRQRRSDVDIVPWSELHEIDWA